MTRWEHASDISDLARQLGVGSGAPVDRILDHCRCRIDGWVTEVGGVTDIDTLEALVLRRLQMVIEEIRADEDFNRLTEVYARQKKDPVFATVRLKFDDAENPTFGALLKRRNVADDAPDRYVAVIDCRGNKLSRRFFTRWHEIAHRLTTHADGGDTEPGYRSEHDPIERMMDEIAGHVGFYGPLFDPVFRQASEGKPLLTFGTVESIICDAFPAASFQATLFACARRVTTPVVYLEAALNHKKEVKRKMATKSLFDVEPPPGELRAVKVIPNKAAQNEGFTIPTNMRVPAGTVIHRLFAAEVQASDSASEDLNQWESRGKSLEARAVVVEGRKVADRVFAIVQPVEEKRRKWQANDQALFES
jgi:hypothetical protein